MHVLRRLRGLLGRRRAAAPARPQGAPAPRRRPRSLPYRDFLKGR